MIRLRKGSQLVVRVSPIREVRVGWYDLDQNNCGNIKKSLQ